MKRYGLWIVMLVAFASMCGGCLKRERSPYTPMGYLEDSPREETVNLWPLYNGNRSFHAIAWPLAMWAPERLMVFPFYNYDKGIHDVALLATVVPRDKTYRVFPFYYQDHSTFFLGPYYRDKSFWALFPFFYQEPYKDGNEAYMVPGIFGKRIHTREYEDEKKKTFSAHRTTKRWALLKAMGQEDYESRTVKEAPWEWDSTTRWCFPLIHRKTTPNVSETWLFPVGYFSSTKDEPCKELLTPLFGWGEDPFRRFWYLLVAGGRYDPNDTQYASRWVAPFYWHKHTPTLQRTFIPPFYYYREDTDTKTMTLRSPLLYAYKDGEQQTHGKFFLMGLTGYHSDPSKLKSWLFPFYWHTATETYTSDLLLPFYYHRRYAQAEGSTALTPLFGWGTSADATERYWYALNCGGTQAPDGQRRWCLPLWYRVDKENTCSQWILFTHYYRTADRWGFSIPYVLGWGGDTQHDQFAWNALLYSQTTSSARTQFKFFPVWSWQRTGDRTRAWSLLSSYNRHSPISFDLKIGPFGWGWFAVAEHSPSYERHDLFPYSSRARWQTTVNDDGQASRYAESYYHNCGLWGLLYNYEHAFALPPGAHPHTIVKGARKGNRSERTFSLLGRALYWKTTDALQHHTFYNTVGYFLWDYETSQSIRENSVEWFTPLMSYSKHTGSKTSGSLGFLLNALHWRWEPTSSEFKLLDGALWERKEDTRDGSERNLLLGSLYHSETTPSRSRTETFEGEETIIEPQMTPHGMRDIPTRIKVQKRSDDEIDEEVEREVLWGILYAHTRSGHRNWTYRDGQPRPEKPSWQTFDHQTSILTPVIYSYKGTDRQGSYTRRILFGLLHDAQKNAKAKTESFGILGFLYRYQQFSDGTEERTAFPFLSHEQNDAKGTWRFSFLHKLFRIEHSPEGKKVWLFWL